VTRDRVSREAEWNGVAFDLIDTGGVDLADDDELSREVQSQARTAIDEADLALLVVDASRGLGPGEADLANLLRRSDKPVVVAANKIDVLDDPTRLERLRTHVKAAGIPIYPVSAVTGEGLPLLLEAVWKKLAEHPVTTAEDRGSTAEDRGSRVEDRGSRVEARGSRVEERGSRVEDRGSESGDR
jgi:GTP-binding protein